MGLHPGARSYLVPRDWGVVVDTARAATSLLDVLAEAAGGHGFRVFFIRSVMRMLSVVGPGQHSLPSNPGSAQGRWHATPLAALLFITCLREAAPPLPKTQIALQPK
jgi:hypothetical protein